METVPAPVDPQLSSRRRLILGSSIVALLGVFATPLLPSARADVFSNVPEASGFATVYQLAIPTSANFNSSAIPYTIDNSANIPTGSFGRVAYYLELGNGVTTNYIYVSFNAAGFATQANQLGVPNVASGEFYQQNIANMNVASNVGGIVTGTGLGGGNVEFWPNNYAQTNVAGVPNASGAVYDWGDQATAPTAGYGSMQIANHAASQMLLSYNAWGTGSTSDIGIGNQVGGTGNPDWTFAANANGFTILNLTVLVQTTNAFWTGDQNSVWTTNNAGNTNWATTLAGTTDTGFIPGANVDVTFSASNVVGGSQNTTLGQDFTIHSLTINDPTAVTIGGANTLTIAGNAGTGITVNSGAGLFTLNANLTLAGNSDTITVSNAAGAVINGTIGGSNGLIKAGTGILTLGAANNYTGGTTIQDGTLKVGIDNALPTGTTVTINDPTGNGTALLDLNGHNQTIAGLTFVAPNAGSSTVDVNGGVLTLNGDVNLVDNTISTGNGGGSTIQDTAGGGALDLGGATRTFTIAGQNVGTDELEIDAVIRGSGGVVINAAPSSTILNETGVFFGAVNTYTGSTTVAQGRLTTTVAGALPSTTDLILGTAGSTLTGDVDLDGTNQTVNSLALAASNTGGTGNFITSNNGPATLTVSSTTTSSTFGGLITGPLSLVKDGNGTTLTLTAANTYTGSTAVLNGTLQVGIDNALPTGTTVTINDPTGNGNALLDINGHNQTISGLTLVAPFGGGSTVDVNGGTLTLNGNVNVVDNTSVPGNGIGSSIRDTAGGGALDLGGAVRTFNIAGQNVENQDLNVSAVIQNGGVIINAVNSSTQFNSAGVNFTGANTYAGGTTITSGYLLANNTTGSATGTGPVMINSGGKLAGTGTITGLVTLNSGGAIEAGSNGVGNFTQGTLHLGSVIWNGGGSVNLELGTFSDQLALTGSLTKGTAGAYTINITDAGGIGSQSAYTLATFASTTFVAGDFTLTLPAGFSAALLETSTTLSLGLAFAGGGPTIQNAAPTNTPVFADFTVTGPVSTGGPLDNNTINSLIFTPGGTLTIFNTLTLTSGNVTTTGGTNSIMGGTLFGPNGLHFDVNGNLFIGSTLIGNAVKTGTGSLFLDGTLYGNMSVLQGLLGGNGSIFGNLFNAGIVSPGHSPGRIGMSGNYTQAPTGLLRIEIGGTDLTQHDLLTVSGTANLDGTLQLVRLNGFNLRRNQSVTFLTANGGVTGRFSMVENGFTSDTILQPTVVYGDTSVALEALQGSFATLPGLTPNQQSVGRALDSAANDRRANALFDYLDYRALNKLPGDLDKISPEELTSVYTLGVSLATVQSLNIQRRTDDIRSGSSGFNAANLALNGDGPSFSGGFGIGTGVAGPSGDDGKEVKETKEVAPAENRWGVFLSGTGEWVSVGDTNNARGYDLESGGFTLGVDYKVTPNLAIGLAAGYTGTTADLTDRGRIWVNGGQLGLYGTFFQNEQAAAAPAMSKDASKEAPAPGPSIAKGFYADVAVFGGYNSYDTRRSALQGEARGSTDGGELNVLFGTGYDFKSGGLTFGPTATFNYTYIGTSDFTEHGSLAPLDVHGGKGESLRSAFGFKASYDWKVGGIVIKPELRAAWQHEYGDAAYAMDSSFASGAGNSFLVNGPKLGRDSALLGAGFAIQCSERCSTYFYYDGELGRTNYQSTNVTGGARIAF